MHQDTRIRFFSLESGNPIRTAFIATLTLAVSACSMFRGAAPPHQPAPKPLVPVAPVLPRPVASHYFSIESTSQVVGHLQRVKVGKDDTLSDIARRFDVGYEEMVLANPGIDPWLPGVGREVIVPTQFVLPAAPHAGVVVDVAAMRIFYYPPHHKGEPRDVYTYPIGIGRVGWKTREGTTKVVSHTKNPVWVVPVSIRAEHAKEGDPLPQTVPPGPDNPLGSYRLRLGWSTYLIHGTNRPAGVGMRVSHGCMHLYPEDIEELYKLAPVGTTVTIVDQPYVFGSLDGNPYIQAYPVMEDDHRDPMKTLLEALARALPENASKSRETERAQELAQAPRAIPIPLSGDESVEEIVAGATLVDNVLPEGSNWNGKTELLIDKKTFEELTQPARPAPADSEPAEQ